MKGSLSSSVILNAMTQDSVADSLDRCMLGDLCVRPLAGPQEQILTVYFSKLKATGRQQFLYFWTVDKLNPARCKLTWQGAIFFNLPIPHIWKRKGKKSNLIADIIDLSFLFSDTYTQQGHFDYIGAFRLLLHSGRHQYRLPAGNPWWTPTNISTCYRTSFQIRVIFHL